MELNLIKPQQVITKMIIKSFGIERYAFIIKELSKRIISKDVNYQRVFNAYYVVRRDLNWRKI